MNPCAFFWLTSLLLFLFSQTTYGELRAGAATANITPWMGISINGGFRNHIATNVHDQLHARCIVLDDGKTKLAIVIADSCMIYRETIDAAKKLIQERIGFPSENILIAATHTHSAPAAVSVFQSDANHEYQRFLTLRLADAVMQAVNHLEPARLGWAVGREPNYIFNRRWKMKPGIPNPNPFGGTNDQVRMNPPAGSGELLEPAGPTDPELPVLAIQSKEGRPIALLANYSLHYCGGVGGGTISADYFGAFCELVQQKLGKVRDESPPFVAILSNGTSGDCNNLNFREPARTEPNFARIKRVSEAVADAALSAYQRIEWQTNITLRTAQKEITLKVRLPSSSEVEEATTFLKTAERTANQLKKLEDIYRRETVLLAEFPPTMPVLIQAIRIGELGISAIPCEVFTEIGLAIKAKSPLKPTFTVELANGYNGYLPTPEQHILGGYETWRARSSYLERDASDHITKTVLELLQEVSR